MKALIFLALGLSSSSSFAINESLPLYNGQYRVVSSDCREETKDAVCGLTQIDLQTTVEGTYYPLTIRYHFANSTEEIRAGSNIGCPNSVSYICGTSQIYADDRGLRYTEMNAANWQQMQDRTLRFLQIGNRMRLQIEERNYVEIDRKSEYEHVFVIEKIK